MQVVSAMKNFVFPAAVVGMTLAGSLLTSKPVHSSFSFEITANDTITYPKDAYKLGRKGDLAEIALSDSLIRALEGTLPTEEEDTLFISAGTPYRYLIP